MRAQGQGLVNAHQQRRAALYDCTVVHSRTAPVRNAFTYGTYLWFVDVDALPNRRIAARDHLGDPARSLRENVDHYLATQGVDLRGGRITMLTAARVFGYVFNPLSVYWCHDDTDRLVCVVAEVHNTYGQRHCYLLRPDAAGTARVDKAFYVSPFEPVSGHYRMSVPEPRDSLDLTITLHRPGGPPFVASLTGRRREATPGALLRLALHHPLAPIVVTLRIRRQGIGLWLRGLRLVPRPAHHVQLHDTSLGRVRDQETLP